MILHQSVPSSSYKQDATCAQCTITSLREDFKVQISAAREESNIDMQVALLHTLNNSLPKEMRLAVPSMFTNAYVLSALEIIEDKVVSII